MKVDKRKLPYWDNLKLLNHIKHITDKKITDSMDKKMFIGIMDYYIERLEQESKQK